MSLVEIKANLKKLGGYEWTLQQLDKLPDEDFDGKPRQSGKSRSAGAFTMNE